MVGGCWKTLSRFAIAAAAGLLWVGIALTPAQAADPAGDCCTNLEERVAELEATTARKSDRKLSLKLSGLVNWVGLHWDDGGENDVYIANNTEGSTRFRFTGAARFKPGWTAGFWLEIAAESARSFNVDQKGDGLPNENADGFLELRKSAWYLKSDRLGEVWLGRYSPATDDIKLLNIADTPNVNASTETGASFFLRAPQGTGGCQGTGCLYNIRLGVLAPLGDTRRGEVIRYNTPSLADFVFSVSWGEDDIFDVAARYEKQWSSIRVVGGIGYHWDTDEDEDSVRSMSTCGGYDPRFPNAAVAIPGSNPFGQALQNTSINNPGVPAGIADQQLLQASSLHSGCRDHRFDLERLAGSISAMHTPSGVYAYFGGHRDSWGSLSSFTPVSGSNATNVQGLRTGGGRTEPEAGTHWYLQLGIKRPMLLRELGATILYGEYQQWDDWGVGLPADFVGPGSSDVTIGFANNYTRLLNQQNAALGLPNYVAAVAGTAREPQNGVTATDTGVTSWGFGMVQEIDKAATQLWLSYRRFDPDYRTQTIFNAGTECQALVGGSGVCVPHPRQLATQVVEIEHRLEDLWTIQFGSKLEF